jgi:hypothetical protein
MNHFAVALLVISLSACSADREQIYQGTYVWGAEVNTFRQCGFEETFWVSASSFVMRPLVDDYAANTVEPYQAIYIRFRGLELNEVVDGFAKDYDGLVRISEVLELSSTIPGDCE